MKIHLPSVVPVLLLLAASAVACGQAAPSGESEASATSVAEAPSVAFVAASPHKTAPSQMPIRRIRGGDAEIKSEIARFQTWSTAREQSGPPVRELYQSCAPGDLNCIPVIADSNTFIAFCRGGQGMLVQACASPGCEVENIWQGGGQLPGTDVGSYIRPNFVDQDYADNGGVIPVGSCVLANPTSCITNGPPPQPDGQCAEWAALPVPWAVVGGVAGALLLPNLSPVTSVFYSATDTSWQNELGPVAFVNNALGPFVTGAGSLMDPNAVFEFALTLVAANPGAGSAVGLYYEVSFDWDYSNGLSEW